MAEVNNATCSICGKGYRLCLSCKDAMDMKPWKLHTDTAEHYKVYQILHGYSTGVYTKSEAKNKLQMVDLSDLNTFRDSIKNTINDIMHERNVKRASRNLAVEEPKNIVTDDVKVDTAEE